MESLEETPAEIERAYSRVAGDEMLARVMQGYQRQQLIILLLSLGLVVVSVLAGVGYFRRPKVMVAVQTSDGQRIAQLDDVKFGATEQIQMGEDTLTNRDKEYLVNQFLQTFYAVDLASRAKDVPKALSFLAPTSAGSLYKVLNEQGYFQRERDEGWSASWKTDSVEVDRGDKNLLRVIGTQDLRRVMAGKTKRERIQFKLTFVLHTEGKREDSPLRSGYWIVNFKPEELSRLEETI